MFNNINQTIDTIIFDFDGVICESIDIKMKAFREIFLDYPEHLDAILKLHMDNGGISRFEKFKIIYHDILKKDLTEEESQRLGAEFTKYSHDAVVDADFVKGAIEFLTRYYKAMNFFIASGTPQEEIDSIVREKKLEKYFKGIYGSPQTKFEIITLILKKNEIDRNNVLFVGDAMNDYEGARQADVKFIGRVHKSYENPFENVDIDGSINDIDDLSHYIKESTFVGK